MFAGLWLSAAFFLLFSGYNALQSLLPTVRPTAGPLSIAVGYLAYAIAAFMNPVSLRWRRLVFVTAATTFNLWVGATLLTDGWLALAAVLNGAGSGLLWTNEGAWLSDIARGRSGLIASMVLVSFHSSTLIGQVLVYLVPESVFWWALIGTTAGTLMLLATPKCWLGNSDQERSTSRWSQLVQSGWLWLMPEIVLFGTSSALVWVALPQRLADFDATSIGFSVFSICSIVGFFIAGQIEANQNMAFIGSAVNALNWTLMLLTDSQVVLYGVIGVAGLSNAALNQSIVVRQTKMPSKAFSCQVSLYCIAYAITAGGLALDSTTPVCFTIAIAVTSCIMLFARR